MKMLWSLLFIPLSGQCNTATISALQLRTSQSSDYTSDGVAYTSERAIDGNEMVCANTVEQNNSWWTVDLLGVYSISSVIISNKDHQYSAINGAQIHIGNSRENNGTTNSKCKIITDFEKTQWNNIPCDTNMSGRYITVSLLKFQPLVLCEVKICGTRKDSPFVLVEQNKTWEDALYYCRDRYTDLASILDEETQAWAELEAEKAKTPFVWLGLHYTCTLEFWFWVEDHPLQFSHWSPNNKIEECDISGAMETQKEHQWFSKSVYDKFNFICTKC